MIRRFLVGLLVFAMVFGIFPTSAFAYDGNNYGQIRIYHSIDGDYLQTSAEGISGSLSRKVEIFSNKVFIPDFDKHFIRIEFPQYDLFQRYFSLNLNHLKVFLTINGDNYYISQNSGSDIDSGFDGDKFFIQIKNVNADIKTALGQLASPDSLKLNIEYNVEPHNGLKSLPANEAALADFNIANTKFKIIDKLSNDEYRFANEPFNITEAFSPLIAKYVYSRSAISSVSGSLVDSLGKDLYRVEYSFDFDDYIVFLSDDNIFIRRLISPDDYPVNFQDLLSSYLEGLELNLPINSKLELYGFNNSDNFSPNHSVTLQFFDAEGQPSRPVPDSPVIYNERGDNALSIKVNSVDGRTKNFIKKMVVQFIVSEKSDDATGTFSVNDSPTLSLYRDGVKEDMVPISIVNAPMGVGMGLYHSTSRVAVWRLTSPVVSIAKPPVGYKVQHIEVEGTAETVLKTEHKSGKSNTLTTIAKPDAVISEIEALGYTMTGIENTKILPDGSAIVKVKYAKNKLTLKAVSGSKEENGHTQVLAGYTSVPSGITVTNLDSSSILARGEGINPGTYTVDFGTKEPKTKDDSGKVYFTEYEPGILTITKKPSSSTPYVPPVDPTPNDDTPTKKEDPKPEIVPTPDTEDVPKGPVIPKLNKKDHFAYIFGYPDGTVRSAANLTREEAAAIFYRLLDSEYRKAIEKDAVNIFPDVRDDKWSVHEIATLTKGGILHGYPDNSFRPDNPITRAEIAKIASMFDNLEPLDADAFVDIDNHWARTFINSAAKKGWIHGYDNAIFQPDKFITREEFVSLVNNMLDRRVEEKGLLEDRIKFPDLMDNTLWGYYPMTSASNGYEYENYERDGFIFQKWTKMKNDHLIKK